MPKVHDKGLKRKDKDIKEPLKSRRVAWISLRQNLQSKSVVDAIRESWINSKELSTDVGVTINAEPFKHCIIQDFIADREDLNVLKEELLTLTLNEKLNDLYQFSQSEDLSTENKPMINSLDELLKNKCRPWLESVTGIKLNDKVSATCSSYTHTDHLLCHDDKCEDRIIAFILYLTENWTSECGGALELFSVDASGQPKDIVKSIVPTFNSFLFFEVTDKSFHQVTEVTSLENNRLSVNGWFHGPRQNVSSGETNLSLPAKPEVSLTLPQGEGEAHLRYINPMYLDSNVQEQIRTEFEESSEILLPKFFEETIFKDLCKSLEEKDIVWEILGPPNSRKYEIAKQESLPATVRNVEQLLQSKYFFTLLKNLTNLDLILTSEGDGKKCTSSEPCCSHEVQRWKRGFYTLVHDNVTYNEFALDVTFYCNVKSNKLMGGYTSYIARDADEELLTVEPQNNALALTFRDKDTLRFVKYISICNSHDVSYHAVQCVYKESNREHEDAN